MKRKTLLLIGPGKSFGKELVEVFSNAGYVIAVLTSSKESLEHCLKDTKASIGWFADIANTQEYKDVLKQAAKELRDISCCIYNSKYSPKGTGLELGAEEFEKSFRVNVIGAVIAIQELAPSLKERRVILTGGGFKDVPDPNRFALSVGKSALHGVYQTLKNQGVSIGTVIIDGAVGSKDSLSPEKIGQAFLEIVESNKGELHLS